MSGPEKMTRSKLEKRYNAAQISMESLQREVEDLRSKNALLEQDMEQQIRALHLRQKVMDNQLNSANEEKQKLEERIVALRELLKGYGHADLD